MLRSVLLGLGCVLLAVGVFHLFTGGASGLPMTVWGLVLVLAVVFERWRYRERKQTGSGEWQATEERFVDPESGRLMQVFYQPATGERRYVPVNDDVS
jgi:hypothetical protein